MTLPSEVTRRYTDCYRSHPLAALLTEAHVERDPVMGDALEQNLVAVIEALQPSLEPSAGGGPSEADLWMEALEEPFRNTLAAAGLHFLDGAFGVLRRFTAAKGVLLPLPTAGADWQKLFNSCRDLHMSWALRAPGDDPISFAQWLREPKQQFPGGRPARTWRDFTPPVIPPAAVQTVDF